MTKTEKGREAKTVLLATAAAAVFIATALIAAPKPAHGSDARLVGTGQLVVVGEVLVAAEESPDGPGCSEPVLAIVPVQAPDAH